MKNLKNIIRMTMVALAAVVVSACGEKDVNGNDTPNTPVVTPTALYSEWLGDWVLAGDNKVSNSIVISSGVVNETIELTGLMRLPFSIEGEYSTERNDIIFSAQVVEKNYKFSDGREGEIHLLGVDRDGKYYGNCAIAIAGVYDNGFRSIVRYGVNTPGYPKFVAMFLTAYINGKYYELGADNPLPTFSGWSELAPAGTSTSSVAPKQLSVGKKVEIVNF